MKIESSRQVFTFHLTEKRTEISIYWAPVGAKNKHYCGAHSRPSGTDLMKKVLLNCTKADWFLMPIKWVNTFFSILILTNKRLCPCVCLCVTLHDLSAVTVRAVALI